MIRNKAVQDQHESAQSSCPNEVCKNAAYSLACGLFHGQVFMKSTLMCALRKATRWLLQSVGRIVITSRKAWALESSLIHVLVGEGKLAYLRLHNSVIFWGDSKTLMEQHRLSYAWTVSNLQDHMPRLWLTTGGNLDPFAIQVGRVYRKQGQEGTFYSYLKSISVKVAFYFSRSRFLEFLVHSQKLRR